jgi:HD-like signal output (HDOD) protein
MLNWFRGDKQPETPTPPKQTPQATPASVPSQHAVKPIPASPSALSAVSNASATRIPLPQKLGSAPVGPTATLASSSRLNIAKGIQVSVQVQPESFLEKQLAAEFFEQVKHCREKFSDPNFDLPMLPASSLRVMNLVQSPNVSPKQIAQALQLDPVLTAKFLRLANSPFYAGTRKVESVQIAVDRLGISTVKNVVLTIALNGTIMREKRLGPSAMGLWDHALQAGFATQTMAQKLNLAPDIAFVQGLMHDLGKLPSWIMLNELHSKKLGARPELLDTLVEEVHSQVGEVLVNLWKMPAEVQLACGSHHAVKSKEQAIARVKLLDETISGPECARLAANIACVALADQALAALGLSGELGELDLNNSELAKDFGLNQTDLMAYLVKLPNVLAENSLKDL